MRTQTFSCSPSVSAVFQQTEGQPGRFLLEDATNRTAIIGAHPHFMLTAKDGVVRREGGGCVDLFHGNPFDILEQELALFRTDDADMEMPFAGGAVGYLSYDLGRSIESIPQIATDDVPTPDYSLGFYNSALCIDLKMGICTAVSWSGDQQAIDHWQRLALDAVADPGTVSNELVYCPGKPDELHSNFTRDEYLHAIEVVKGHIAAGDVYQVNLAQRFETRLKSSPWALYQALRRINPAPKCCYIEHGDLVLVSASPETFLSYSPVTRTAVTKPIKGTRPRGHNQASDSLLAQELAASIKDRAENLMIVDMLRNDLGRVAEYGSVTVPKLWDIEAHPNVFQMVSTVEATLAQHNSPIDLLISCFPGGSITGAPKLRAMEIIEQLEPHRRGIYTGSAGFIDFRGFINMSIVIRSFVVHNSTAYFHAGGGIVADSDPESEYQETLDKIAGLRAALRESEGDT